MDPIEVHRLTPTDIDQWFRCGVTLLVGSWISNCGPYDPPGAMLPDGGSWASIIWNQLFGSPSPSTISEDLKRLRCDFDLLPFEALMQSYQDRNGLRDFLRKQYGGWAHNHIHKVLATALATRRIQSIITTNYDLGIEHCLEPEHKVATVFDEQTFDRYRELHKTGYVPYYKIHGTALPNCEHSLICNLGSEGRLVGWKLELLQECLQGRILIVVGYSGRDFDICPVLSWKTSQAETIWFARNPDSLSPMAQRLVDQRHGTVVYGNGIQFIERLFGQTLNVETGNKGQQLQLALDPSLLLDWRLRLLNWMAAGTLMLSYLDDFVGPEPEKFELRAAAFAHIGKYRDVVGVYSQALRIPGISTQVKARLLLGKSGAWLIYGAYVRSLLNLLRARHTISLILQSIGERSSKPFLRRSKKLSVGQYRSHQDLFGRLNELEMVMYMRFMEISHSFGLGIIAQKCRLAARGPYRRARAILERTGSHDRLQALQHNAERLGIAKSDGMALPIDPGYGNLGLASMKVIALRDRLRKTPDPWSQPDLDAAKWCLEQAEYYGWRHEAWKFSWLLIWHLHGSPVEAYREQFRSNFRQVQMPFIASVLSLRRNCGLVDASATGKALRIDLACVFAALGLFRFARI